MQYGAHRGIGRHYAAIRVFAGGRHVAFKLAPGQHAAGLVFHQVENTLDALFGTLEAQQVHVHEVRLAVSIFERLFDELVKHGKLFEFLGYPNRTHSISERDGTRAHLYSSLADFLQRRVVAGPRAQDSTNGK